MANKYLRLLIPALVLLGGASSLVLSLLTSPGYSTEGITTVDGPGHPLSFILYADVPGFRESRAIQLPLSFQNCSAPGDQLQTFSRVFAIAGRSWCFSEAFLYRKHRRVASWREWWISTPLLMLLVALAPFVIGCVLASGFFIALI